MKNKIFLFFLLLKICSCFLYIFTNSHQYRKLDFLPKGRKRERIKWLENISFYWKIGERERGRKRGRDVGKRERILLKFNNHKRGDEYIFQKTDFALVKSNTHIFLFFVVPFFHEWWFYIIEFKKTFFWSKQTKEVKSCNIFQHIFFICDALPSHCSQDGDWMRWCDWLKKKKRTICW